MPTIDDLIRAAEARFTAAAAERKVKQDELVTMRSALAGGDTTITEDAVKAAITARDAADAKVKTEEDAVTELRAEKARDEEIDKKQRDISPSGARKPAYDQVARVGSEERTYAAHKERGFRDGKFERGAKPGAMFERDVAAAVTGDYEAQARLARHQQEERVERAEYLERAVGTGAFAGLVVPQYLTDLYAPAAAARRPFADACRTHDLPAQGMTVSLSRITTSTDTGIQASENTAVTEQNIDDTLLTVNVQTNAGQQTMSRQSIERGAGTEPVVLDDLFRRYGTRLDSTLLNQATNGLTNVATSIAYTDATPTVAEVYPKTLQALAAVEATLMDLASGDNIAVMHSRRWYWMQNALSSTWPIVTQPGILPQMFGTNFATVYGSGIRGVLPNGTPVIVDNNIATNLGAGTNEDEIYIVDRQECHLWEDAAAPMFIRAEQPAAASLGVLLVLYGYFAYTHARYSQAQKINGTGLITPTYTGV